MPICVASAVGCGDGSIARLTIIKAAAYGTIGIEALNIVLFNGGSGGDAEDNARLVMRFPLGEVLIVLIGIGVAIYGFTQLRMAWDGRADDDIDVARVKREAAWILPLGRIGTAARSVILIAMGVTLLWSGLQERPSNADGYSEVLAHDCLGESVAAGGDGCRRWCVSGCINCVTRDSPSSSWK